jgi:hypothetical protein
MRKLLATFGLAALLVAGACGGSDDKPDNASATSDTTTAPAATAGASAGDFGKLCGARASFAAPNPAAFQGDAKSALKTAAAAMDSAVANSPSDIKADVQIVVNAAKPFYQLLASVDYDYMKLATDQSKAQQLQALGEKFNEAKVKAAADRVEAWAKAHCS